MNAISNTSSKMANYYYNNYCKLLRMFLKYLISYLSDKNQISRLRYNYSKCVHTRLVQAEEYSRPSRNPTYDLNFEILHTQAEFAT